MEMKQIELKELIREVLLTEFQRGKEIESKINEFRELNDEIDRLINYKLIGIKTLDIQSRYPPIMKVYLSEYQ
jgi:hypothetical protein